ncbi:uncharacterized protein LOC8280959 isoform X2 [Ricinus communis]|uniref:uncharacterized protein LOC8280959 isoform X2 n=1 Tax=Ricinus communis TaxID=3988 RepID=UPI000772C31D|nr:uncharacterized protein LOC8280959 isoform X2 [Ricinus communis]|eukprot:XP_015574329.1 uncharacterized protein LOC8280959 isoform X1 [Ricinus communis]
MNWIQRKIYLYNVTFGLYMLDWWERCLFNTLVVVLMWFIFYNGSRYVTEVSKRFSAILSTIFVPYLVPRNIRHLW